jgi:hypothetical protein
MRKKRNVTGLKSPKKVEKMCRGRRRREGREKCDEKKKEEATGK